MSSEDLHSPEFSGLRKMFGMDLPEFALSIRQPFASAIIHRGKDIENRTWRCPAKMIGQRVMIHAGASNTDDDLCDYAEFVQSIGPHRLPGKWPEGMNIENIPRGGIIGSAIITACVTTSESQWFVGPFGFVLTEPRALPFMPCRGMLGFFHPKWGNT